MTGELPGGLFERGACARVFKLRPVTGQLELAIAEAVEAAPSLPAAITAVLSLAVARIGESAATPPRVGALCIPDRQYLLARLQVQLGRASRWQSASCRACDQVFDFYLNLEDLPVRSALPPYPFGCLRLAGAQLRFRVPNGDDQEAIAAIADETDAQWALARRCWVARGTAADARRWERIVAAGDGAMDDIEAALDAVAPGVATSVRAECPHCKQANDVAFDLLADVVPVPGEGLLQEVHQLAWHYHWSEGEILRLPRARRQHYLQLVDQARGMSS